MQRPILLIVAATLLSGASVQAQPRSRNTQRERRIEEALASVSAGTVLTFRRATQSMDDGKHAEAESLFREVLASAPQFTPAMRRLGGVLIELGRDRDGLALLNGAVQIDRSPENLVSLATALTYRAGGRIGGSTAERASALKLAQEAAGLSHDPNDESYDATVAQLAIAAEDDTSFRQAVERLTRNHPQTAATHYFAALAAAVDGRWEHAEDEIRQAERLGLPHEAAEHFLASGVHTRARVWRYARYAVYLLAGWVGGLLLLFTGGQLLSRLTLSSIERADPNVFATDSERSLRRIYRALINCAGAYYYLSLPFVVVLVVGGTSAVVYGFMMIGRVPLKLVAFLVLAAAVTVFKMAQSLFIKVTTQDPGRTLKEGEAPALWKLAREVAATVGTRPVDEIRVTPGTDMAVYERGSASERRRDCAHRVLVLGVGLVNGFSQDAFRAVLAHEYGHFAHRDTAGGDVALRVRRDMMIFAIALYQQGQAVWWNLAFVFLRIYDFLFRRISHGAIRLQEVLADRVAAHMYGPAAFEAGLRHVIARSVEFETAVTLELQTAAHARRSVSDLYTLPPLPTLSSMDVKHRIADALSRPTTEDDTHPGPSDRFRLIKGVRHDGARRDPTPVWDLFTERHRLTAEMTAAVASQARAAEVAAT
jgi:Zn-dependent protease with chaperone function/tetratricopeptide (TPR) repeat protein